MADHHAHHHHGVGAETAVRPLGIALALIVGFMVVEVVLGVRGLIIALYISTMGVASTAGFIGL